MDSLIRLHWYWMCCKGEVSGAVLPIALCVVNSQSYQIMILIPAIIYIQFDRNQHSIFFLLDLMNPSKRITKIILEGSLHSERSQYHPQPAPSIYNIDLSLAKWKMNANTVATVAMLLCLLGLKDAHGAVIVTDAAGLAANITYMTDLCASVPTSSLGLCNTTCLTCLSISASSDCASCGTGYRLSGKYCILDNSVSNYTYYKYAGNNMLIDTTTIGAFRYSKTNQRLSTTDILSSCNNQTNNNYEFISAGLFKTTDIIELSYSYVDPIDKIQIKFKFKSMVSSMKLFITLNDNLIYSKNFTQFSDLTGNYTTDPNNASSRNFILLPSMSATTINSIWLTVDTGFIDYIVSQFTLKFYVQSNSTQLYTWGFHDMVVLQRSCQTCVTQAVQNLMKQFGASILVTLAIVIVLMIVLFGAMQFSLWRRKVEFQEKLGSSSSNLPTKAINRVLDAIKTSRKNREKEWTADNKIFKKAWEKLNSR